MGPALLCSWVFRRWFLYIVFVFLLGTICTREALRYDFLIAEKVGESCIDQRNSCAESFICSHKQMAACLWQSLGICLVLGPGWKDGGGGGKNTEEVQVLPINP